MFTWYITFHAAFDRSSVCWTTAPSTRGMLEGPPDDDVVVDITKGDEDEDGGANSRLKMMGLAASGETSAAATAVHVVVEKSSTSSQVKPTSTMEIRPAYKTTLELLLSFLRTAIPFLQIPYQIE